MGLNDNFIIDTSAETPEPQVKVDALKDTRPGEEPEMNDGVDLIGVLEQDAEEQEKQMVAVEELCVQLTDIVYVQQRLLNSKGISQQIALESCAIVPTLLDENRPVGSYTKTPTQVNYKPALEEVENAKKGMGTRILEAVKKALKAIRDFVVRLFGGKTIEDKAAEDKKNEEKLAEKPNEAEIIKDFNKAYAAQPDSEKIDKDAKEAKRKLDEAMRRVSDVKEDGTPKNPDPDTDLNLDRATMAKVAATMISLLNNDKTIVYAGSVLTDFIAEDRDQFLRTISDYVKNISSADEAKSAEAKEVIAKFRASMGQIENMPSHPVLIGLAEVYFGRMQKAVKSSVINSLTAAVTEAADKLHASIGNETDPEVIKTISHRTSVLTEASFLLLRIGEAVRRFMHSAARVRKANKQGKGSGPAPATENYSEYIELGQIDSAIAALEEILEPIQIDSISLCEATSAIEGISLNTNFLKTRFGALALEEASEDKPAGDAKPSGGEKSRSEKFGEWIAKIWERVKKFVAKFFGKDRVEKVKEAAQLIAKPEAKLKTKLLSMSEAKPESKPEDKSEDTAEDTAEDKEEAKPANKSIPQIAARPQVLLALPDEATPKRKAAEMLAKMREELGKSINDQALVALFLIGSTKLGQTGINFIKLHNDAVGDLRGFLNSPKEKSVKFLRTKAIIDNLRKEMSQNVGNREQLLDELFDNLTLKKRTMFLPDITGAITKAVESIAEVERFIESSKNYKGSDNAEDMVALQHTVVALNGTIFEINRAATVMQRFAQAMSATISRLNSAGRPANEEFSEPSENKAEDTFSIERVPSEDLQPLELSTDKKGNIELLEEALDNYVEGLEISNEAYDFLTGDLSPRDALALSADIARRKVDRKLFTDAIAQERKLVFDAVSNQAKKLTTQMSQVRKLVDAGSRGFFFGSKKRDVTQGDLDRLDALLTAEQAGVLAAMGLPNVFGLAKDTINAISKMVSTDIFDGAKFADACNAVDKVRTPYYVNLDKEFIEDKKQAVQMLAESILQTGELYKGYKDVFDTLTKALARADDFVNGALRRYMTTAENRGYQSDLEYFKDVLRVYELIIATMQYIGTGIWTYSDLSKKLN